MSIRPFVAIAALLVSSTAAMAAPPSTTAEHAASKTATASNSLTKAQHESIAACQKANKHRSAEMKKNCEVTASSTTTKTK